MRSLPAVAGEAMTGLFPEVLNTRTTVPPDAPEPSGDYARQERSCPPGADGVKDDDGFPEGSSPCRKDEAEAKT